MKRRDPRLSCSKFRLSLWLGTWGEEKSNSEYTWKQSESEWLQTHFCTMSLLQTQTGLQIQLIREAEDYHYHQQIIKCLDWSDIKADDYQYHKIIQSLGNLWLLRQNPLPDTHIDAVYNTGIKRRESDGNFKSSNLLYIITRGEWGR